MGRFGRSPGCRLDKDFITKVLVEYMNNQFIHVNQSVHSFIFVPVVHFKLM